MPVRKLKDLLDDKKVRYVTITHSKAYTSMEIAQRAHIPGKELAKPVMVKVDGKMAMAVLPATYKIDLDLLKNAVNAKNVELAQESEFENIFPDCEVGAMPPFGRLYGMQTFVAKVLSEDKEIFFNAGNHTELIRLSYGDYQKLEEPKVVAFSRKSA